MGNKIKIYPGTTGYFRTNYRYLIQGAPSQAIRIPIPFYLITHPKGLVLFDAGLGEKFLEYLQGWWAHRAAQFFLPYDYSTEQAAVNQIRSWGFDPNDVRYVVASHAHYDHIGGAEDFSRATLVVSQEEWKHSCVGAWRSRLRGVMKEQIQSLSCRVQTIQYQRDPSRSIMEMSHDLMNDGSIVLYSTPGHTPGHQSVSVTLDSGKTVFLTGDAVWLRENYLQPAPKGWLVRHLEESARPAWETTLAIRKYYESHPETLIIPGHDPFLWKELPKVIE